MKFPNRIIFFNKRIYYLLSILILSILLFDGIYAYFTDIEAKSNVFTMGNVNIELIEPRWNSLEDLDNNGIPDIAENIVSNTTIEKDPKVKNVGSNPAYIFIEINIPYSSVSLKENNSPVSTELFSYTINEGWTEIGNAEISNNLVRHVYVYGSNDNITELNVGEETLNSLFSDITFKNLSKPSEISSISLDIDVKAYAIQITGLETDNPLSIFKIIDPDFNI